MAWSGLELGSHSRDSRCVQPKALMPLATALAPAPPSRIPGSPVLCVSGSPVPRP